MRSTGGVEFEKLRTPLVRVGVHPIISSTKHLLAPSQLESQLRLTKSERYPAVCFEVSGFQTKTRLLQRHFIFLNLFQLQTFCVFIMHHSKPRHQFSTLSDFICYFSCIY